MSQKTAKQLKKGERIRGAASNGHTCYVSWLRVVDIEQVKLFEQPTLPKKGDKLLKIKLEILQGKLRGEQLSMNLFESEQVFTPNKPWKIVRIWRAIIS